MRFSERKRLMCVSKALTHTDSQIKAYIRIDTLAPAQMTEIKIVANQNVTQNDGLSHKEL